MADFMIQPAETLAVEYWKRVRLEPCFNTTDEDIPPFACMQLRRPEQFSESQIASGTPSRIFTQHLRRDQVMWDVAKCNDDGESRQDPSEFVFNGRFVIPSLRPGLCTQDLPCQALHNGDGDSLPNFTECGPVKDQWYLKSGRSAFSCMSHDISNAAGTGRMHTIWINRGGKIIDGQGRFAVDGTSIATDGYFTLGTDGDLLRDIAIDDDGEHLIIQRTAMYFVSLAAKLAGGETMTGSEVLTVKLYQKPVTDDDGEHDEEATNYRIEMDVPVYDRWNGATNQSKPISLEITQSFAGYLNLKNGDKLAIKNSGDKKVSLTNGLLSVASIGAFYSIGDGDLKDSPDTAASS